MQKIKIRAWDKQTKTMITSSKLCHLEGDMDRENDRFIFMLYINWKDMYGVEMYEDDVCRLLYDDKIQGIGIIQYDNIMLAFTCNKIDSKFPFEDYPVGSLLQAGYAFEVIGNIHQNPELV